MSHLFMPPAFFFQEQNINYNGVNCGKLALGIMLAFLVLEGGVSIIIYVRFIFFSKILK